MMKPLVTVAIPTYNRPKLLVRALNSLVDQDYENLEIIISDNASPGNDVETIVELFKAKLKNIRFFKQARNIGALNNFFFLLDQAEGDYFMWLADDDEISKGFISHLTEILIKNTDASCASGNWFLMRNEFSGRLMPKLEYKNRHWFFRVTKYILFGKDDFFYGIHRVSTLKKAEYKKYFWPNQNQLSNWAYGYLLDQIILGKVLVATDPSIKFINHDYGKKNYIISKQSLRNSIRDILRKFNLYVIYLTKIKKHQPQYIPPSVCIILIDFSKYLTSKTIKLFIKNFISNKN
jgi:glycosyltransferase involved in cell wall biosynthesis